jgi:glutathione S-transferase
MRLYHSPTTPFGRKVMVLLLETGLPVEIVSVMGNPLATGTLPVDQNPLGKIPALELDDGRVIHDSRVITRYLNDLTGAGLYPAGPALWDALTIESMADGMIDAGILMAYEVRLRPADKQFPEWIEAQWAKIARSLDALESTRMPMLRGDFGMAQVAVACALDYIDLRHSPRNWRSSRPQLAGWAAEFGHRPSMQATLPPPQ